MFGGYRPDDETGVVRLIEYLGTREQIKGLKICCDSSDTNKYTAICLTQLLHIRGTPIRAYTPLCSKSTNIFVHKRIFSLNYCSCVRSHSLEVRQHVCGGINEVNAGALIKSVSARIYCRL